MLALAPIMPAELYRDVISNLDSARPDARKALLSLALVSQHMRHDSQRVLFASNELIPQISKSSRDALARHHQFIQTIFNHPARFGRFVQTLIQVDEDFIKGMYFGRVKLKGEMRIHERLQELTVKTLPYLINLRSLVISRRFATGSAILSASDFQLKVLQYQPSGRNDHFLSTLLPNQRGLLHMSVYPTTGVDQWSVVVMDNQCSPTLISAECAILELPGLAQGRNIVAFTLNSPLCPAYEEHKRPCRDVLLRLKYLNLCRNVGNSSHFMNLESILGGTHLNIELLQLHDSLFEPFEEPLAPLPELHGYFFQRSQREIWF